MTGGNSFRRDMIASEANASRTGLPRWLIVFLLASGGLAITAMAFPVLVVLGEFLILPGLVLLFAPTAFLWSGTLALAWVCLGRLRLGRAIFPVSAALAAGFLWLIPQGSLVAAQAQLARYRLPDVAAPAPIVPAGNVRVELGSPDYSENGAPSDHRPYRCDDSCLALLFTPGVTSVTVGSSRDLDFARIRDGAVVNDPSVRTYRLIPRAQCSGRAIDPGRISGAFGEHFEDNQALASEWKRQLTEDVCLVADAPLARFDLLLRVGGFSADPQATPVPPWSFASTPVSAGYAEARTGAGKVLMRAFPLSTRTLAAPLAIGDDAPVYQVRFGWARTFKPRAYPEPGAAQTALFQTLAVPHHIDPVVARDGARAALLAATADARLPASAPVFGAVVDYLNLLARTRAGDSDAALVIRLLDDPRLSDLPGAWALPKSFPPAVLARFRKHIARKIMSLPDAVPPRGHALGSSLEQWPEGSFAVLDADEQRLLADPDLRVRALGLIARQADRGTPAAEQLVRMLREHIARSDIHGDDRSYWAYAHEEAATAAVYGLCQLGPLAHAQLSALQAMENSVPARAVSRGNWQEMMVRIGKPIDEIAKPADIDGTEADYRARLQRFRQGFDPARDCRLR